MLAHFCVDTHDVDDVVVLPELLDDELGVMIDILDVVVLFELADPGVVDDLLDLVDVFDEVLCRDSVDDDDKLVVVLFVLLQVVVQDVGIEFEVLDEQGVVV